MGTTIIGCGKRLPQLEVENDALKALVDTNDEWISTRTGIKTRRIAVAETNTDLGEAAARQALGWEAGGFAERRVEAAEIDLVICATITPDAVTPSQAGLLRRRLGLDNAIAFDVNAACSGFVYGLTVAESLMAASSPATAGAQGRNPVKRALVVGAERLTRLTNWADRNTCVLFGDGAGAAVLEWSEERAGMLSSFIVNEDDVTNALTCAMGYDAPQPFDAEGVSPEAAATVDPGLPRIDAELGIDEAVRAGELRQALRMDGPKVFKFAAEAMTVAISRALERAGLELDDVACIVPHQANERIIKYAAKKLGRPMDFFQLSIANAGNSSAASVPMALSDAYASGRIERGDKVVLVAFGGGFTSGAVVFEA
ncbi:3-oxoacyl-ACP synthase III family protein [Arabiibacter massiliensis]|uniref:3-oxoacyl-ACP synthase III family protein n=1 Tax=Arabiibacter massiliensis TaxID=1870985 RepID=UPI0009B9EAA1|nr:beta-ketoacyl-ACP synthase 3 [Arabiibacter massiliensis]